MAKLTLLSVTVLLAVMISGCDSGGKSPAKKTEIQGESCYVTLNKRKYPVYPGAELLNNLMISVSYRIDAEPSAVKEWYDKKMAEEGWRFVADWVDFGGQDQKDFLRGESMKNSNFAEEMVKLGVGPHKNGGTHFMIIPIVNKYQRKK